MTTPVIRIHVGAHKTATTYIQDALALNQAASANARTAFWPRDMFRPALSSLIQAEKARRLSRAPWLNLAISNRRKNAQARLQRFFDTDYDVTISDENLLGEAPDCTHELYPFAHEYLADLKAVLPDRPIEIYVALRSYPEFISSLFGEGLKHGHFLRTKRFRSTYGSCVGVWPTLLARIRETLPEARIIAWRYEDFATLENDLLSRLSGLEPEKLIKPAQSDILPSASALAITQFLEKGRDLGEIERQLLMLALQDKHPREKKTGKFTLWDDSEMAQLRAEYDEDIERIKASGHVDFL